MILRPSVALAFLGLVLSFSLKQIGFTQRESILKSDYRLGFTVMPDDVTHQGNEGMRAGIIDTSSVAPTITLLNTPYVPVWTGFAGWLRDGNVILTTARHSGAAMMVDSYVVNPKTGNVVSCLTCSLHAGHSLAYIYSQTPQPVYASSSKDVSYYVVSTHYGPINSEGVGTGTQVWTVGPDGKSPHKLLGFDVGMHGCEVSPDGRYLACQPFNTTDLRKEMKPYCWVGVLLIDIKTGTEGGTDAGKACIGNVPPEYSRDSVAVWSPDSKGFLYFSQVDSAGKTSQGWLNYYAIASGTSRPNLRLAQGVMSTYFCNGLLVSTSACPMIGVGNSGGDAPVWSPCATENPCSTPSETSKWIFFSSYYQPKGASTARQVIGKVSLDRPNDFIPITDKWLFDAGHPAISADGARVAFLVAESRTDRRSQIYVLASGSSTPKKLTSFTSGTYADADPPQWAVP